MYPLRFGSTSVMAEKSVSRATKSSESELEPHELKRRSEELHKAVDKLHQADSALQQAREHLGKSKCRGLIYRIEKILGKVRTLEVSIADKTLNLERRRDDVNGN